MAARFHAYAGRQPERVHMGNDRLFADEHFKAVCRQQGRHGPAAFAQAEHAGFLAF